MSVRRTVPPSLLVAIVGVIALALSRHTAGPAAGSTGDTGAIAGTVTDSLTSAPLANVIVEIYDANGADVAGAVTDASGRYTFDLLPGTYYARTFNSLNYQDDLYDGLPCSPTCAVTSGTPISVSLGVAATVDFGLLPGNIILGTVTDAATGLPIPNVMVNVLDAAWQPVVGAFTHDDGTYYTIPLTPGTYYLQTVNDQGYRDELYDNLPCVGYCGVTGASLVAVVASVATTGIDFALDTGASLAGRVTDRATGAPIANVSIDVFDSAGRVLSNSWTRADGAYGSTGFPPGRYRARTRNQVGYIDQVYSGIACVGGLCDPTGGTEIVLSGTAVTEVDFTLDLGGHIAGTIRDAASGEVLDGVAVEFFDQTGRYVTGTFLTTPDGTFSSTGLSPGVYFARTYNRRGLKEQLYAGKDCVAAQCDVTTGTPIVVDAGATTSSVDFAMIQGAQIVGLVLDAVTGLAVPAVEVDIFDASGNRLTYAYTDSVGRFTTTGLLAGTYYARTFNWAGYVDQLYDGIACPNGTCAVTSGRPIELTDGAVRAGVNFNLGTGGRIAGIVSDDLSGSPLSGVWVGAYVLTPPGQAQWIASVRTDTAGGYTFDALADGTYFLSTYNDRGYIDEVWDNVPCAPACALTAGTPIVIAGGSAATADFGLAFAATTATGTIAGTIVDAVTSQPVATTVDVYTSTAELAYRTVTNASGQYTLVVPAGTYYVRTSNSGGYGDQLFNGIDCQLGCNPTTGTAVTVAANGSTAVNFALQPVATTFTVTNTNDAGPGSLRTAIDDANSHGGADRIAFNIAGAGPHVIQPLSPLPPVTEAVVFDGTSQPGFANQPLIELDGAAAGPEADGLSLMATSSTVRALTIENFARNGIRVAAANNQIHENTVKGNGGTAIAVVDGTGNLVSSNSIFENGFGIDLGTDGATPNDEGDVDGGPNNRQNFPDMLWALAVPARTTGRLQLRSTPNATFAIELFDNDSCDPSGYGQGQRPFHSFQMTTDESGHATADWTKWLQLPPGHFITATTTDAANNTSEFSACMAVTSEPTADLSLAIDAAPDPVKVGESLTYNITVTNAGPSGALDVVLDDSLPVGFSPTGAMASSGGCSVTSTSVQCQLATLLKGETATVTITGTVTSGAPSTITNTASVSSSQALDPAPGNNSISVTTAVAFQADLEARLTAVPDPVNAGETLTYELGITNHGPSAATNVKATLTLVPGVTYTSQSAWCSLSGRAMVCSTATLASGGSIGFNVSVKAPADGSIDASLSVQANEHDPQPANNTAALRTTVRPPAVINVTEQIVVHDAPTLLPSAMIAVNEAVRVTDAPELRPSAMINIAEQITVTDAPVVRPPVVIAVTEAITVSDNAAPVPALQIAIAEHVTVNDGATVTNTPVGAGVVVKPVDSTAGGAPVSVTFSSVTGAGLTTLTTSSTGDPPPQGFEIGSPAVYFEIGTTAVYSGSITVCISYAGVAFTSTKPPRLFHLEGGVWVDRTVSVNRLTRTVCGLVASLSPFAVFGPVNRPPIANAGPDQVLEATSVLGAPAVLDGSASSDPDGDPLTYTWTGPFGSRTGATMTVVLPLGTSTITLTVDDGNGGTASDTVDVTVRDTTPPAIVTVAVDKPVLWPPDHKMVLVGVRYTATDAVDRAPVCGLGVTSNEPENGTGDGDTAPDWIIVGAHSVQLRAERAGRGNGRVYRIGITCSDASGNTSNTGVSVTVPRNR